MISIKKDFDSPPTQLSSESWKEKIKEVLLEKNQHNFSGYYYAHDTVRKRLRKLYHEKCAYCESKIDLASFVERIDHYRPKNKIQDEPLHEGYYWLGYEWSNLMPICEKCNRQKSNQFPISPTGIRIFNPTLLPNSQLDMINCKPNSLPLLNEQAYLLHPEIDTPEQHIIFLPNGKAKALGIRGEKTIEICKLNRTELIIQRNKVINNLISKIRKLIHDYISNRIEYKTLEYSIYQLFDKLVSAQKPQNKYSRLGYFLFHKFDIFILSQFGNKQKQLINNIFENYKRAS